MKILLINPPRSTHNMILQSAPEEAKRFIHKKLIGPPLGLLTIAAAVKDFDVTVFDIKGEYDLLPDSPPLDQMVREILAKVNPDIVGITIITSEFDASLEIFRFVKQYNPAILTIAGGLHTTLCPEDFNDPVVDVICPGQSANAFREVVIRKEKQLPFDSVNGIILNDHGNLLPTKPIKGKWNPANENFLMPDRSLIERWRETYKVGNALSPTTYLFTSLGCPYRCTFCSIWQEHQGLYHQRTVESVIEELKMIDYNIVRFADANSIVNIDFINQLFDRIREEGIQKEYIMDIRADTAVDHPELIEKLARQGLKVVICGFESFRDSELKKYNKKSQADRIHEAIDIFHKNGILLRGNYVVPHDYTLDDFKELAAYANSHRVSYAGYTILTPMPGTNFYQQMKKQIIDQDLSKYNFFNSVLKTTLPLEQFYENVGKLWLIKKGNDII
jgi:hopanoid C-3 methylase